MESIVDIRKMLDRFYAGESTLEEERKLQDYFSAARIQEELIPDRDLFRSLGSAADSVVVPDGLNQKILAVLGEQEKKVIRTRRITVFSLSGLAAGLLVVVALYVGYFKHNGGGRLASNHITDTYSDPQDAYEEAKRTLAYVSAKLSTGTSELEHVAQVSKTSTEPLKSLSKINKGSKELSLLGQLQHVNSLKR